MQDLATLATLSTEARNARSEHIDELSTLEMLTLINREDATVAGAVSVELPHIARAVDAIAERFARGGRLFYLGAGTSGRLGVLDASECPPTFSVPATLVQSLIAGGDSALRKSSEHAEDSAEQGARDLAAAGFGAGEDGIAVPDTLVGIAASGRTPYVLGALSHARSLGALTIGISCVAGSPVAAQSEIAITPVTGAEVITGSTRMKAGTAAKLVLNMLSTGAMIRTGAVFGNLMVNLQTTNAKLIDRGQRILMQATGVDRETACRLLAEAGSVKTAIAMHVLSMPREAAEAALARSGGDLKKALLANRTHGPDGIQPSGMRSLRRFVVPPAILLFVLLAASQPMRAYSVLTHEEVIDLTWEDSIKPLLLHRYPNLTPEQLRDAHAYAYGGCVIQDLGYYPFGKQIFSNLLHYVRTGDFIRALFRDSKGPNDVAFAIGALSHYLGDTIGHPDAVNLAVATEFPALERRYGPNVNYAEGEHQHVRAEFAFDINDIVKHRLAPERYLNHIGFAVPVPLLARAFYDTYGLDVGKILGTHRPTLKGYRYSVRTLLPRVAYAETLLYRKHLPPDAPSPALDALNREVAALAAHNAWASYRRHAGFGTHLLAGFIFILPKVGALSDLSLRGPTPATEQDYVRSLVKTTDTMRQILGTATTSDGLPNQDLDTGLPIAPGSYSLADYTYADLLHDVTRSPAIPVPFGIKRDLLAYFADLSTARYIARDPKRLAQVEVDLPVLRTISTKAAYPETAFLPEPEAARPDPQTKPGPQ